MRQYLLILLLLPGLLSAQDNAQYDPDFDDNACYTIMDVLALLIILMPDDAGMDSPNPNYDPDSDGDGTIEIGDLTHLLTLFGTCEEAPACSSPSMDGYTYDVVQIGDQCWFAENLRTTTYLNGDVIPAGLTDGDWTSTTSGATAVYGEDDGCDNYSPDIDACDEAQSLTEYGRLYNWHSVDDARSLCPSGWHVPTDEEWTDLEDFISAQGFSGIEGTALKSTYGWSNSGNGTDDFGFSALPGGYRDDDSDFHLAGSVGYWWSSSPFAGDAWNRGLSDDSPYIYGANGSRRYGLSVRCLRDADYAEVQGCTDPAYVEYDATATTDDGSCVTLIDPNCVDVTMDGHTYSVVQIGDQCWFAENLRTTTYLNGDVIPAGLTDGEWWTATSGATAVYGEGSSTCFDYSPDIDACDESQSLVEYGRLYNGYAVDDARGLCPSGWHVSTDEEWTDLEDFISAQGFSETEGTALKATFGWSGGGNGTDDFGFSALPGGSRFAYSGSFDHAGYFGTWWSASPNGGTAWYRYLFWGNSVIVRDSFFNSRSGFSVRCLRDADNTEVQGCTDPAYVEYDATATTDDGSCVTLIDPNCVDVTMDGHTYSVVQIGDQCWFAENLRTTTYLNGDVIPAGLTDGEWWTATSGATAVYGEGSSTCFDYSPDIDACDESQSLVEYGRLYNGYAVDDARGLCPSGWHVSTDEEWTDLEDFISAQGFSETEGTALKATFGWSGGGNGTDDFGFSALPGGSRFAYSGSFDHAGYFGTWWSASPNGGTAWYRYLFWGNSVIVRDSFFNSRSGFSVRCLRDADNTEVQGCTDPAYVEYDATATTDDGSCMTLIDPNCVDVTMDGHTYSVVQIGDQCWFAENLRTTTYLNGDVIPAGLTDGEWWTATSGATAVYGEGSSTCFDYSPDIDACDESQSLVEYGRLYNGYAVDDARGLCPSGWHVSTDEEWTDLEDFISAQGFSETEGTALKATFGWSGGGNGTDDFGFSALPGGSRFAYSGSFDHAGYFGTWWSASPNGGTAWYRYLFWGNSVIVRDSFFNSRSGFSVRCLRDAD